MNTNQAIAYLDNIKILLSTLYPTVKLYIVICNNDYHFKIIKLDRYDPNVGWIERKVFSCYKSNLIDCIKELKIFWETKQHYIYSDKKNGKGNN